MLRALSFLNRHLRRSFRTRNLFIKQNLLLDNVQKCENRNADNLNYSHYLTRIATCVNSISQSRSNSNLNLYGLSKKNLKKLTCQISKRLHIRQRISFLHRSLFLHDFLGRIPKHIYSKHNIVYENFYYPNAFNSGLNNNLNCSVSTSCKVTMSAS